MAKIINLQMQTRAADEQNTLWFIGVSPHNKDTYSCEYKSEDGFWVVTVNAGSFQTVAGLVVQCRHALGWDTPADWKEETAK